MMLLAFWPKLALFAGTGIVFAALVWALWRAHDRRVAAAQCREKLAREEAASARERLEAWLSGASHALSQPLTALHGTLELALLSRDTPAEARRALEDALQQVQSAMNMTRLLRELADAETSGQSVQTISLTFLFEEWRQDLESLAQARGRRLSVQCENSATVLANGTNLRRAIHYLVEHALERSPAGGLVQIATVEESSGASIVVRDDGPAIPANHLPHWFEPFYSGRGAAYSKQDALRLAIVERTCASCRGNVSADNNGNGGARFVVRLRRP